MGGVFLVAFVSAKFFDGRAAAVGMRVKIQRPGDARDQAVKPGNLLEQRFGCAIGAHVPSSSGLSVIQIVTRSAV